MGTWDSGQKEFWWEREWRHVGDFAYRIDQVAVGFCPESEIPFFEGLARTQMESTGASRFPPFVDPRWGLETMLVKLAGLNPDDVDQFANQEGHGVRSRTLRDFHDLRGDVRGRR
jgi:hypothetical protein